MKQKYLTRWMYECYKCGTTYREAPLECTTCYGGPIEKEIYRTDEAFQEAISRTGDRDPSQRKARKIQAKNKRRKAAANKRAPS